MEEFLDRTYFNNTVKDYLIALGIILVSILLLRIFRSIVLKRLKVWATKTETNYDDLVVRTVERFGMPALNFIAIYWGINSLTISEKGVRVLEVATASVVAFFIIRLISSTIRFLLEAYVRKQEGGEEKVKQIGGIILIISIVVWGIGLVFLFDNLGYDVTAIIAGLGVGGIAIALAAQNILGDLFNYFVIFFDRPFEIGDFLVVDDKKGNVEHIGIKTTRLKSLSGEQLVFSNSYLMNSRIHNYKRMARRRIDFTIGVTYQTTPEQLREIPVIIKNTIDVQENATLDRTHFAKFGDFSLNFETIYFVESAEYNVYMDIQQQINLKLVDEFASRGIEFAYPTQTLFVTKEGLEKV
jgi:small-conductance mechanosensitive channel